MDQHIPLPRCNACKTERPLFPFTMAFQPIVDIEQPGIVAHEALVRGLNNEGAYHVLSQLTPETMYSFDQVCRTKAIELATKLKIGCRLNINFLPNAVYEPAACIRATLKASQRFGFPLNQLTFEVIETEQVAEAGHLQRIIGEYRRHGFQIALDDFGAGYSGLARLAALRPDIVKLDRDLVRECHTDQFRLGILRNLFAMGHEIGVKVVAEGVETEAELGALRSIGARYVQGYLFSKPLFEAIADDTILRPARTFIAA